MLHEPMTKWKQLIADLVYHKTDMETVSSEPFGGHIFAI